jgi:hypothetical protein
VAAAAAASARVLPRRELLDPQELLIVPAVAPGAGLYVGRGDRVRACSSGRGGWGSIATVFFRALGQVRRRIHLAIVTDDKLWGPAVSDYNLIGFNKSGNEENTKNI